MKWFLAFVVFCASFTADQYVAFRITSGSSANLLHAANFTYNGASLPPNTLDYSYTTGNDMAFDPAGNSGAGSIYMSNFGSDTNPFKIGEISIATPSLSASVGSLNTASIVQAMGSVGGDFESYCDDILAGAGAMRWGGLFVDASKIVYTCYADYDASGNLAPSHFVTSSKNTSSFTRVDGPCTFADSAYSSQKAGFIAGKMKAIPSQWQSSFGGYTHITGLNGISIISRTSAGPTYALINLADVTGCTGTEVVKFILGYPSGHQTLGPYPADTSTDRLWSDGTGCAGFLWPTVGRTVISLCAVGTSTNYCYGTGVSGGSAHDPSPMITSDLTGSGASTSSDGLTITVPNADLTNVFAFDSFIKITGETSPTGPYASGCAMNYPGMALITNKGNSGLSNAFVTVDAARPFTGSLTSKSYVIGPNNVYDPDNAGVKGGHAQPLSHKAYLYDINDLITAYSGSEWVPVPYEVVDLDPFYSILGGFAPYTPDVAYDPATQRFWPVRQLAAGGGRPLIDQWTLSDPGAPVPVPILPVSAGAAVLMFGKLRRRSIAA